MLLMVVFYFELGVLQSWMLLQAVAAVIAVDDTGTVDAAVVSIELNNLLELDFVFL